LASTSTYSGLTSIEAFIRGIRQLKKRQPRTTKNGADLTAP
jgi:hypothetical protein